MATALIALIVAAIGFDYFTLMRTPAPFVDEAWNASRAWGLIQTGRAFGSLDAGVFDRYAGYWTYFPWLGTWIHALAIRALGLSLFSVRFTSFVFGLALLAAVYAIGRHLGGQLLGLLGTLLVATSTSFIVSSHMARHDVIVSAIGFSAIALYLTDQSSRLSVKSVVAGLAVGLTLDIHPNGIMYAPAIASLYLLDHGVAVWRVRRFWGFTLGVCVGIAYFAAMHILPYPQTYLTLSRPFGVWHAPPFLVLDPSVWLSSFGGLIGQCVFLSDLRMPLVIAALVILWRRGSPPERKLAAIFSALLIAGAAVIREPTQFYGILVLPAADLLVAAFLIRILTIRWVPSMPVYARAGIVCALVAATTVRVVWIGVSDFRPAYNATSDRVAQAVGPEGSVMGSQTYWLALTERRYLSWDQLVNYRLFVPGSTLEDAFDSLRPDFLIVDGHMDLFIGDDKQKLGSFWQFLFISRGDLSRFLNQHARLVDSFDAGIYGNVRVYRIDWK